MQKGRPPKPRGDKYGLRKIGKPNCYEFEAPRAITDRSEDMEDVRDMIVKGEIDVAIDELRWLLSDCPSLMEAHAMLGLLAMKSGETEGVGGEAEDEELALAHLECAIEIGRGAINKRNLKAPLSFKRPANRPFFEAGLAMIRLLRKRGDKATADALQRELLTYDRSLPLPLG